MKKTDWVKKILEERMRQIKEKGYTAEHDDTLEHGELASFASATLGNGYDDASEERQRHLVKAAALILAELERIERKLSKQSS